MNNQKNIAIDLDDTVIDAQKIFCEILYEKEHIKLNPNQCTVPSGKFMDQGLVSEEVTRRIITSEDYLERLFSDPPIEYSIESIKKLSHRYHLFFLTSRDNLPEKELKKKTLTWLEKQGLYDFDIIFSQKKGEILKAEKANLFIEDSPIFVKQALEVKVPTILFTKSWNRNFKKANVFRIDTWKGMVELVDSIFV